MSLNLHLLRLFTTVVRTGSFSRAAEALHISQPAISKGVRDFELQVGCRLLDRTPKGVRPTREGKALVRHAEALFAAERAAEDELLSLRNLDSGSLRIGEGSFPTPAHLAGLAAIEQEHVLVGIRPNCLSLVESGEGTLTGKVVVVP